MKTLHNKLTSNAVAENNHCFSLVSEDRLPGAQRSKTSSFTQNPSQAPQEESSTKSIIRWLLTELQLGGTGPLPHKQLTAWYTVPLVIGLQRARE